MTAVPLGNIISTAKVKRLGTGRALPILSMTMREGLVDQSAKFKKRIASLDLSPYRVVERGQLVVGFPIDEGVLSIQDSYSEAVVSPAYGIWDVDDEAVDGRYLELFLRSPQALGYYKSRLRGSTARRRSIPAPVFLGLQVPLPPLSEQRRIASILEEAAAMRATRSRSRAELSVLADRDFVSRFGDIVTNDRGWEQGEVGDLVSRFSSGKSLVGDDSASSMFRVLKVSSVTKGSFDHAESKPLPPDYQPPEEHIVRQGDLLISRANTAALVGATALVTATVSNLALPDKIWRFHWRDGVGDPSVFMWRAFSRPEFRRALSEIATGSGGSMKNITQAAVLRLPLAIPPRQQRDEFTEIVSAFAGAESLMCTHLTKLDELFASLQHRAFRGEL